MRSVSRKVFLREFTLLVGAAIAGCSPVRILLHDYPSRYDRSGGERDRIFAAFTLAVIPGADPGDPNLIRIFSDGYYPFAAYGGFFAADLDTRSAVLAGSRFADITPAQRTAVIEEGLADDDTTARLYRGAVLLAQVAIYGGVYDDARGCPLIDFHGRDGWRYAGDGTVPDLALQLADESTTNGNYA